MIDIRPVVDTDLPHILKMVHALAVHHGDPVVVTLDDLKRDFFWVASLGAWIDCCGAGVCRSLSAGAGAVRGAGDGCTSSLCRA